MTDFGATWELVRKRFDDAVGGLSTEQLNWRIHPGALTIGEMALHVAGVEVSFVSQLLESDLDDFHTRLKASATDGVVNDNPFPFKAEEITPETVASGLANARRMTTPVMESPSEALLGKTIVSALGPLIDGRGALARLAYHPGYHQGQVHIVRSAPGMPG